MIKQKQLYSLWLLAILLLPFTHAQADMRGLPNFVDLVAENNKVVVNISTIQKVDPKSHGKNSVPPQFRGLPEEFLRHFFGMPHGFNHDQDGERQSRPSSLGSGFIISSDGYILTNHHVIEGADEVIVRMRDRKEMIAEIVGSDPRTDVAVLKIDAKGLPYAKIGHSASLKVGQWVLAIGEPFGLDYTVTHGIVSALGRALPDDTYVPFIQTDVPINPGNSGGPLFNLDGEVVGINSQIYSKSGGSMGLSFSIPIDIAMNVAEQIKSTGSVTRGFLGVQVQEVTSELSESFGLDKPVGALVGQTYDDTPAAKYGIQAGDIILKFNGKVIEKSTDLPPVVGITPIDKPVPVEILRQGKRKVITVRLQALDNEENQRAEKPQKPSVEQQDEVLGAEFADMQRDELRDLGIPYGVKVLKVTVGAMRDAGVRPGDVLMTVDFKQVSSVRVLKKIIAQADRGRSLPVRVLRNGRSMFLPLVVKD